MPDARFVVLVLVGFILGSLPFSVWVGRLAGGPDVRRVGSRNPGAANVWRNAGRLAGALAAALDAAKGAAAVWMAWAAGLPDALAVWPGAAAVVGHDFSPLLRFRGGKGGATTVGALACFLLPELLLVLVVWTVAGTLQPRRRFLWSMVSLTALPLLALVPGRLPVFGRLIEARPPPVVAAAALLMALLWLRVAPGLRAGRA